MATQMFMWKVGSLPLDVVMERPGVYEFMVGKVIVHRAQMVAKGDWALHVKTDEGWQVIQIGLGSLRDCIAMSYGVSKDLVRNATGQ